MSKEIDISDAEFEVMQVLWQYNPATAKIMLQRLERDWHLKTLNTLLSRLVKKGAISFSREGREYLYTPLIERDSYIQRQSQNFLQKAFGGRLSPFVAHFSKHDSLEQEDIDALKKLIDDWESDNE